MQRTATLSDTTTGPLLALSAVGKRYGAVTALRGVSFSLAQGEFVALLGPNGAGKTTLAHIVSGLLVPDEGTVHILGHDMRHEPEEAPRQVGVVAQQPMLDPGLTLSANLHAHCELHEIDPRAAGQRIEDLLERFALRGFAEQSAGTLEGADLRKLQMAFALLHRPRLLVMDEPTIGLDPAACAELIRHVLALRAEEGVAILWATHLLDEAEKADRLIFINDGAVVFDGTGELRGATPAGGIGATSFGQTG